LDDPDLVAASGPARAGPARGGPARGGRRVRAGGGAAMIAYAFKRVLLMVPTLFGILLVTFAIIQFVPGGPVDQLMQELRGRGQGGAEVAVSVPGYRGAQGIDEKRLAQINEM